MQAKNGWVMATVIICTILLGGLIYSVQPIPTVIPELICPTTNDTSVLDAIEDVQLTLDEDEDWKGIAKDLASDEWKARQYKDIYRVLENIDDRDDIEKVVITDEEVTSYNVDDEDAIVVQKVKVYYENDEGDDKKVKLIITTEIEEGEVEDQDIEFD